jgi:hypothetical protein
LLAAALGINNLMRALPLCSLIFLCSCVGPSPARLTTEHDYMVVVNSVRLPDSMPWYTVFAEHSWVDMKNGDEDSWQRVEIYNATSGPEVSSITAEKVRTTHRFGNRSSVLSVAVGEEARLAIPVIHTFTERYELDYEAWPGPNSNTFISDLLDATDGIDAQLHHNAAGKDFPWGYFDLGFDSSGDIELHLMQLTLGISFWPPAIKLPLLPRLGAHQGWVDADMGITAADTNQSSE